MSEDRLIIEGGHKLEGEVFVSGAKNSALPIMAASILIKGDIYLKRIPDIEDVRVMIKILRYLGAKVEYDKNGNMLINTDDIDKTFAPYELVSKIHASFDIAGPLLARFNKAEVALPGGCVLGYRGVDYHIEGFKKLSTLSSVEDGFVKLKVKDRLKANRVYLPKPSVGATKNIMMAAIHAEGTTIIENAAREPEIVDLANFLQKAGAKIRGAGTSIVYIDGIAKQLKSFGEYEIISDRIEAGTYLIAGPITKGYVKVNNINYNLLDSFLTKLESGGIIIERGDNYIVAKYNGILKAFDFITAPYPGFPTDLQPPTIALLTVSKGTSFVQETIFDARFTYIPELERMGAKVKVSNDNALIYGVDRLNAAPVHAPDIRAGAALVLAALNAEGKTEITGVRYIDRGYENLEDKLNSIGAKVIRQKGEK